MNGRLDKIIVAILNIVKLIATVFKRISLFFGNIH